MTQLNISSVINIPQKKQSHQQNHYRIHVNLEYSKKELILRIHRGGSILRSTRKPQVPHIGGHLNPKPVFSRLGGIKSSILGESNHCKNLWSFWGT